MASKGWQARQANVLCPPGKLLLQVLLKVEKESADAIVVCPRKVAPAVQLVLDGLARASWKVWRTDLKGDHAWMVRASVRVPEHVARTGWVVPLRAWQFTW